MSGKNLFSKPFDEGTLDKLKIFEDYFKEWLPVFIAKEEPIWKHIQIFDLFAGEGKDKNGIYGSPLRVIKILNDNKDLILKSRVKIRLIINEFDKEKFGLLEKSVDELRDNHLYKVELHNKDFNEVFNEYYESMNRTPNFLFLDQNGIKQITENIFTKLISLKYTDFIFFISSSYIKRFGEVDEFKKYLKISKEVINDKSYHHIHRVVLNYYRSIIPHKKEYYLAPFSIKKPSGIFGLIFGTNHTLGIEKFLTVCWKHDKLRGEANFDIDNEKINPSNPGLFVEYNTPSKRQVFEIVLEKKILNGELENDYQIYLFTYNEGFLCKDANIVIKKLISTKRIKEFKTTTSNIHKLNPINVIKIK